MKRIENSPKNDKGNSGLVGKKNILYNHEQNLGKMKFMLKENELIFYLRKFEFPKICMTLYSIRFLS